MPRGVHVVEARLKPGTSELDESVREELGGVQCRGEKPAALLAGGKGPGPSLALVSCASRLVEEYGVGAFLVLATPRTKDDVVDAAGDAERALGRPFTVLVTRDDAGYMETVARRIVELLSAWGCGPIICPTPGSIRAAVAVTAAGLPLEQGSVQAEIVHLDYWWGPWSGLPYPLVPRSHEPIYAVVPTWGSRCEERGASLGGGETRRLVERYAHGELRRCIARRASRLNAAAKPPCNWLSFSNETCTGLRLELRLPWHDSRLPPSLEDRCAGVTRAERNAVTVIVHDWCEPSKWIEAARCAALLAEECRSDTPPCTVLRVLARASGLYWWVINGKPIALTGERLLVDTNLVHGGAHIDWYMGARVSLPWGLVAEVERGYAEAAKDTAWRTPNPRLHERSLSRITARIILREMLEEGVEVVPSGDPPLDTGVLRADPLILSKYTLATEDRGAYELWKSHPLVEKNVAKAALATRSIDPWEQSDIDPRLRAARASYALLHVACLAEKLLETLPGKAVETIGEQLRVIELRAQPPLHPREA